MAEILPEQLHTKTEVLVAQIEGTQPESLHYTRLPGGANNRVFRVDSPARTYCLKWYFSHPDDPRDRLAHEWGFSHYAWSRGIRVIPKPLVASPENQLALYRYREGRKLSVEELTSGYVSQAVQFICRLNRDRESLEAARLPIASEACFNRHEHLQAVDRRVNRFIDLPGETEIHENAARFVREQLVPCWQNIKGNIESRPANHDSPGDPADQKMFPVISPSDFGFHNAILGNDGTLSFHDFEYAGRDSLIKLVCDFFHQPQIPVPITYFESVIEELKNCLSIPESLAEEVERFFPVYGIKWCCILLNDFLPTGKSRRSFSRSQPGSKERLALQLAKAESKLNSVNG